jgi:glycosyltransferase involved in cell wall biosynthesis
MEPHLVSVVIPCYKQAHFLAEAIESVLAQSSLRVEVLVVDDGSPDDTREVAARYPSVRYVHQSNQGVAAARNTGIRESTGDYLVFLDADDRLLPEALQIGSAHLGTHPECAFVYGRCTRISVDGSVLWTQQSNPVKSDHYLELLRDNFIFMPATVMFRRAALCSVGGLDTSFPHGEDYELYLRITRRFPVSCHDAVVAEYREHPTNKSGNPARMLTFTMRILQTQRKHARGDRRRREAYRGGVRHWQTFYGEPVMEHLRSSSRARADWRRAAFGLLVLLRYCPRQLAWRATRKAKATLTSLPRRLLARSVPED